jgi:hypothetical protein
MLEVDKSVAKITAEMVDAGFEVFVASGITDDPVEVDKLLVQRICRAMAFYRPAYGSSVAYVGTLFRSSTMPCGTRLTIAMRSPGAEMTIAGEPS